MISSLTPRRARKDFIETHDVSFSPMIRNTPAAKEERELQKDEHEQSKGAIKKGVFGDEADREKEVTQTLQNVADDFRRGAQ